MKPTRVQYAQENAWYKRYSSCMLRTEGQQKYLQRRSNRERAWMLRVTCLKNQPRQLRGRCKMELATKTKTTNPRLSTFLSFVLQLHLLPSFKRLL